MWSLRGLSQICRGFNIQRVCTNTHHIIKSGSDLTDLQRDHVGSVLLPDAEVIHEVLEHVEGLFLAHVQQQHSGHEADSLAVADLCEQNTKN